MDKTSPHEVLLKYGKWISSADFAKLVAETRNVSERQARALISKAYRDGLVSKHIFPDRTVIYGLTEFGPPTSEAKTAASTESKANVKVEEAVGRALEDLRLELCFFREPTVKEVACRVGVKPAVAETVLYALAPKSGWMEPDEYAEKDARDVINLAGWLSLESKDGLTLELKMICQKEKDRARVGMLKRAQGILSRFPTLVPDVAETLISWPEETKVQWYQVFGTKAPSPFWWVVGMGFVPFEELKNLPGNREIFRGL